MRRETKIGNTNYIVNGNYRAAGAGISLSSALFRLMEKDLQRDYTANVNNFANSGAVTTKSFAINDEHNVELAVESTPDMRYNCIKSQNVLVCKLQAEKEVLV